mmetsp:Transcript_7691/g.14370  ORF Transcript_7691/g.14370 Transcript_7691/m.14370 type:complete len:234 (+) Transcript_7691:508-1209(+)
MRKEAVEYQVSDHGRHTAQDWDGCDESGAETQHICVKEEHRVHVSSWLHHECYHISCRDPELLRSQQPNDLSQLIRLGDDINTRILALMHQRHKQQHAKKKPGCRHKYKPRRREGNQPAGQQHERGHEAGLCDKIRGESVVPSAVRLHQDRLRDDRKISQTYVCEDKYAHELCQSVHLAVAHEANGATGKHDDHVGFAPLAMNWTRIRQVAPERLQDPTDGVKTKVEVHGCGF